MQGVNIRNILQFYLFLSHDCHLLSFEDESQHVDITIFFLCLKVNQIF